MNIRMVAIAILCLTVAACSSGGGGQVPVGPETQLNNPLSAAKAHHNSEPYVAGSHVYSGDPGTLGNNETYIGGDLEPRESLRHILTDRRIRFYMGTSRDGAGVERLEQFADDLGSRGGFYPFRSNPRLYYDRALSASGKRDYRQALLDSVGILNDTLPPEYQIMVMGDRATTTTKANEIMVSLGSAAEIRSECGAGAAACAITTAQGSYTHSVIVHLPDDLDTSEYRFPRSTIVHELLHALGISGHVDSEKFPDSLMGEAGEYFPNPGHVISRIDREVLQSMYLYMKNRTSTRTTNVRRSWEGWIGSEWTDTSIHLAGRSTDGNLNFGVALSNQLPLPWVRGAKPTTDLRRNTRLRGTATWNGGLVGFSGPTPLAGKAQLVVRLSTLSNATAEQDLRFRDIYFLNRIENRDRSADSPRWFDTRNIDYKVKVDGNVFRNVTGEDYEEGHVAGAFLGRRHEHMGGTVKRTDMVGAFGGSR